MTLINFWQMSVSCLRMKVLLFLVAVLNALLNAANLQLWVQ